MLYHVYVVLGSWFSCIVVFHNMQLGTFMVEVLRSTGIVVLLQCEGVGKDSIPGAIDFNVVDDMMQVTDKQSFTVSPAFLPE